jgi:hypothetical protein
VDILTAAALDAVTPPDACGMASVVNFWVAVGSMATTIRGSRAGIASVATEVMRYRSHHPVGIDAALVPRGGWQAATGQIRHAVRWVCTRA